MGWPAGNIRLEMHSIPPGIGPGGGFFLSLPDTIPTIFPVRGACAAIIEM
jgi:hypothetical protein